MKIITSRDNTVFKQLRTIAQEARERRRQGLTVLDGLHLVRDYLEQGGRPELLAVAESAMQQGEIADYLRQRQGQDGQPEPVLMPDALLRQASPVDSPTGILALIQQPPSAQGAIAESCVVLDGVQDAGNVGSILRSAAAAGVRDALLTPGCAGAWSPRVLRAAMGAHFRMRLFVDADPGALLAGFQGRIVATRLDASQSLFDLDLCRPVAWLLGNEGAGLSQAVAALATDPIRIPMPGGAESLNVAAAAAVCLFEQVRQKVAAGLG